MKKLLAKRGIKLSYIADALGISQVGLSYKMRNPKNFKVKEIETISEKTKIDSVEIFKALLNE